MEQYEYDHNLFSKPGAGDDTLFVQFYDSIIKDETKSSEEGRPCFKDAEFVKIFVPGDRNNIIDRPATPMDKLRFAKQYALYKSSDAAKLDGTPLAEWPIISRSQAEELKYLGFVTVEQIANARDEAAMRFPGLINLKQRAIAYLELAKGSTAPIEALTKRLDELEYALKQKDESIAAQATELKSMRVQLRQEDRISA